MADNPAAMEELRALLAARESTYAQAQATIDTTHETPTHLAAQITNLLP